jgi:hypothetical protein
VRSSPTSRDDRGRAPNEESALHRLATAYLALVALALVELYAVGALRRAELISAHELIAARDGLIPIALALSAPIALACWALFELLRRADKRAPRVGLSVSVALFAGATGWGVAAGRAFEHGRRLPFALGLGLVAFGAAFAIAPRVRIAAMPRTSRARWLVVAFAVLTTLAIECANELILPRLYLPFHLALAALACITAASLSLSVRAKKRPWITLVVAVLGTVLGLATARLAASKLAKLDNVRLIYVAHAPLLRHVVAMGAELVPPAPIDDEPLTPAPIEASDKRVDLAGRDFLLVTIDALRADHVGAYGYARATTPNLDKLAAEGVRFDHAYSPTPHTSYAVTSIMTGKYMRPLLLQGLGDDSETWAAHLRRYGYKTAAFYPPAVFFIDGDRFASIRDRFLDFEYRRVEFLAADKRADQVRAYLAKTPRDKRVFLWVHLFEPHEPYEAHADHAFGDRDVDRYDAEIAAADAGLGAIVATMRAERPEAVVIVAADHGEEFDDHGGRYHGTTTYEEQVRVPLVVNAPKLISPRVIAPPVQLVDLLPTVLAGLSVPRPARVRGTDLGPLLAGGAAGDGFAFAETDEQMMLAKAALRLVCARAIGACALYDVNADPGEKHDVSAQHASELGAMRAELRKVEASHGKYEVQGLRREGKGWPEALRRGIAGDGDATGDVAALLDDADVAIRRKAAEVLFDLARPEAANALRLSVVRDEDDTVKRWAALALTRLGEGAPRVRDLVTDPDVTWRRLAALALAEQGDTRGEDVLVAWWRESFEGAKTPLPFGRAKEIAAALGKIKAKSALGPLIASLDDLRVRPHAARALAAIGESSARPALAERLAIERYPATRLALFEALVKLGAGPELRAPLVRFLGTPDPLPGGVGILLEAAKQVSRDGGHSFDLLELVGGPRSRELERLRRFATSGVAMGVIVPAGGNGKGLRVVCRARTADGRPGELRVGERIGLPGKHDHDSLVPSKAPEMDSAGAIVLAVAGSKDWVEPFGELKATHAKPGEHAEIVVYATQNVELSACVVVPTSDELPPPPPEPWTPPAESGD